MQHPPKTAVNPEVPRAIQRAMNSTTTPIWCLRPPKDVRRLVARAIRQGGHNKSYWVSECVRVGLAVLACGKTDVAPKDLASLLK